MDGISNFALPLVITAIIANGFVSGVQMDEGSSCNLFYLKKNNSKLGFRGQELKPHKDQNLFAFNISSKSPCR